jgi:transposase
MQESITVFVGMDIHKDTITMAWLLGDQAHSEVSTIQNEPKSFRRALRRIQKKGTVRACYEAGPCGFEPWRQMDRWGIHCSVIAPALVPRRPGERIKTDRRDAIKLARLLRAGELTAIHIPTAEEESVRDLVRVREDLRRDILAARHRLSKFLLRHGRIYREGRAWTNKYWAWLRTQRFEFPAMQATFDQYVLTVRSRLAMRESLDQEIAAFAESAPFAQGVARLRCLRGIDTLSALTLMAEIQDFRRFASAPELMSFVGLVPCEYSSGQSENRGRITKAGNAHVRRILVEAAWAYRHRPYAGARLAHAHKGQDPWIVAHAWKAQVRLNQRYRRLVGRGRPHQVAVIAVARELAGFIWGLMRHEAA